MKTTEGFTLIELMVTVAILAVLASIAIPAYNGYITTGHKAECQTEAAAIQLAEEEYFLQNSTYKAGTMNAVTANTSLITPAQVPPTLAGIYTPSNQASSAALTNCTYVVTAGASGIATSYVITATGVNQLQTQGVILVFTK